MAEQARTVHLWGGLRPAANGAESVELNAGTIRELMRVLCEQYPKLAPFVDEGIAVSVDGTIYRDDWSQALPDNAEIYLLPRIEGG